MAQRNRTVPGDRDVEEAAAHLAARLPPSLAPLARVAYDLRWTWTPGGSDLFAAIDADRWSRVGGNAVRLLDEADRPSLERAAADADLVHRAR
jgi:glycogen phosphorylase